MARHVISTLILFLFIVGSAALIGLTFLWGVWVLLVSWFFEPEGFKYTMLGIGLIALSTGAWVWVVRKA